MRGAVNIPSVLVSSNWLNTHLKATNLVVLDATLPKVTAEKKEEKNQLKGFIPGARFFDIKNVFSDTEALFPNTRLSHKEFEKQAQLLGINNDSCIIVYDDHGIYSSPRAWWSFKAMGFDNVAVLDGGLPSWLANGFPISSTHDSVEVLGDFRSKDRSTMFSDTEDVLRALNADNTVILDARSAARFEGLAVEPRTGVRSGHIPNSKSLPYSEVLNGVYLRSSEALQKLYEDRNVMGKKMIFSCGTGITACVLALGAEIAGYKETSVYDGSWTEWGSLHELPIEK